MVTVSQGGEPPTGWYYSSSPGRSASLKWQSTRFNTDEVRRSASTGARQPRARRPLVATFVAVSAIIFFVYMCILSIGRRLTESSFSRNLAASLGEEECGESEDSGSTASPAGTSSEVQAAIPTPVPSAVDILSPQPGNTELISSVRAAAGASVQMIARTGIPPLWMQRRQTAVKRKGEEQSPVEKQATQIILAPPRVGAQPGPPAPPLDPELDSLIDSVLFGSEPVFSEDFWLRDDGPLHQKADPLAGTRPLALGDDSELPDEGERVEKAVSLLSAAPSTLKSDHELPPNHPQIEKQSKKKGLKRKLEEQNKAERNAKQFSIKTPSDETQLQPQLHPLDPDHDSLLGPILSGGHLFKQFRILHDDPLHPTADYSMSARFPTLEHDSERLYADKASGKALHAPPAAPSTQPSDVNKPGRRKISEGPLPGGASCRRMQRSLPGDVETADTGPPSDATKLERKRSPRALKAEASDAPKRRNATSSEGAGAGTLPSSPGPSPAPLQPRAGILVPQDNGLAEQSASSERLAAGTGVTFYLRWLENVHKGVPESILRMHPFYRYPECCPALIPRSFDVESAAFSSKVQIKPSKALAKCSEIMKKALLTPQDLEELLVQTERLCGYALAGMPVTYRIPQPLYAVETLGTVFLVLDTLYCAAAILGDKSKKQLWWPLITRHIGSVKYFPTKELLLTAKSIRNTDVACALDAALEYYRRGERPPLRMIIGLKEALLCRPNASSRFRGEQWNPWREDAEQWRMSIQPNLAVGK